MKFDSHWDSRYTMVNTFELSDNELVDSTIGSGSNNVLNQSSVLLTNQRVIGVTGKSRNQELYFCPVSEVKTVSLRFEQSSEGSLIWPVLGFLVAIILILYLDNPLLRFSSAAAVAAISGYLLFDRFSAAHTPILALHTGDQYFHIDLPNDTDVVEIHKFMNRIHSIKRSSDLLLGYRASKFAPR